MLRLKYALDFFSLRSKTYASTSYFILDTPDTAGGIAVMQAAVLNSSACLRPLHVRDGTFAFEDTEENVRNFGTAMGDNMRFIFTLAPHTVHDHNLNTQAGCTLLPRDTVAIFFHKFCGAAGDAYLVEPQALSDGDRANLNVFFINLRLLGLRLLCDMKRALPASADYLTFSDRSPGARLDKVLGRLVSEGAYEGSERSVVVDASINSGSQQRDELAALLADGMVLACKMDDTPVSTWQLSKKGSAHLHPLHLLDDVSQRALTYRTEEECTLLENHVHELLFRLDEQGWEHKVYHGKRKGLRKIRSYVGEGPKQFWSHRGDSSISKWYLLALLLQAEKKWTVEHGLNNSEYEWLVTGKPPKRHAFRFGGMRSSGQGAKRRKVAVGSSSSCGSAESAESDSSSTSSSSTSSSSSSSSSTSSSSTSSSTSSTSNPSDNNSSSTSSSSSSSSNSGEPAVADDIQEADAAQADDNQEADAVQGGRVITRHGIMIGPFKFTAVFKASDGSQSGIEATCYDPRHHCDRHCRKTRSRTPWTKDAEELTLRELRWWCHAGRDPAVRCRKDHLRLAPEYPEVSELPSMEELDALDMEAAIE